MLEIQTSQMSDFTLEMAGFILVWISLYSTLFERLILRKGDKHLQNCASVTLEIRQSQ